MTLLFLVLLYIQVPSCYFDLFLAMRTAEFETVAHWRSKLQDSISVEVFELHS